MKVYTKVGSTVHVLHENELWTANLDDGFDFDEKSAAAIVKDFRDLDPKTEYWST